MYLRWNVAGSSKLLFYLVGTGVSSSRIVQFLVKLFHAHRRLRQSFMIYGQTSELVRVERRVPPTRVTPDRGRILNYFNILRDTRHTTKKKKTKAPRRCFWRSASNCSVLRKPHTSDNNEGVMHFMCCTAIMHIPIGALSNNHKRTIINTQRIFKINIACVRLIDSSNTSFNRIWEQWAGSRSGVEHRQR